MNHSGVQNSWRPLHSKVGNRNVEERKKNRDRRYYSFAACQGVSEKKPTDNPLLFPFYVIHQQFYIMKLSDLPPSPPSPPLFLVTLGKECGRKRIKGIPLKRSNLCFVDAFFFVFVVMAT